MPIFLQGLSPLFLYGIVVHDYVAGTTTPASRAASLTCRRFARSITRDGQIICADVNGSYNILRKSKPDAFAHVDAKGLAAYVVQPLRLAITV